MALKSNVGKVTRTTLFYNEKEKRAAKRIYVDIEYLYNPNKFTQEFVKYLAKSILEQVKELPLKPLTLEKELKEFYKQLEAFSLLTKSSTSDYKEKTKELEENLVKFKEHLKEVYMSR